MVSRNGKSGLKTMRTNILCAWVGSLAVLLGLPAALLFAYLTVANVFIYLNLRYDTPAKG